MYIDAKGNEYESIIGRRARVVEDNDHFFNKGEVVVILEDSYAPYCVFELDYYDSNGLIEYEVAYSALILSTELEIIE